jgi:large subunit ribosomal protein L18
MFRRRREQKTNYRQRLALLKSGKPRLVVRRALNNIRVQLVRYERDGDTVVVEANSRELRKHGWLAHCGSTPAAYLTGLLAGLKAMKAGVEEVVADLGLQTSVKGSSLYAAVHGAKDAGLSIPVGKEILPDSGRISGRHIAQYAALLKKDKGKYKKQFSSYIKNNLDPEKLPEHFEDVKKKMLSEYGKESGPKIIKTTESLSVSGEEWEDAQ